MTDLLGRSQVSTEMRTSAQLVLAEALLKLRQFADGIEVLQAAIVISESSRSRALCVELYDRMGMAFYQQRQPHEAGRWWDKAINAYEQAELRDPLLRARI